MFSVDCVPSLIWFPSGGVRSLIGGSGCSSVDFEYGRSFWDNSALGCHGGAFGWFCFKLGTRWGVVMGFVPNGLNVKTEVCVKVVGCGNVVRRYFPSPSLG